ncbi:MAG: amidohydrolase family protein, partial [Nitrospirota bacterium]|nr:amidohydrolase family protein [Nitrospirota bacterium]
MESPVPQKSLIDCHVHLAAFRDKDNGCFISSKMLKSPLFRFLLWKHGLDAADAALSNRKYVDDLLRELRASKHVGRAVLLGMDGAYDGQGMLDRERTDLLVSNSYVLDMAKTYPDEFLAGVSINPQRRDAIEEVERCAAAGSALVKVLPNAQGFDPGSPAYIPFYRALARHRLPLLSHVGYEFSLIGKDQSVGDPDRLRVPLDEGVTVIAAHGCSNGLIVHEPFYETLLSLVHTYPRFFTDLSALTLPNRFL